MRTLLFLLVMAGPALADPVADQARNCFNPAPGVDSAPAVDLEVTIGDRGSVADVAVTDTSRDMSRSLVMAWSMAIERCAPYAVEAGLYPVTLTPEPSAPIDPFRK